jgi:opacity protein-like surface antigen
MMKKMGILVLTVAMMASMVSVASAEIAVSGDVYAGLYNKYIFRGLDSSGNQWVSQFGADLSYKNFTLSYWSNLLLHQVPGAAPRSAGKAGEITETDVTLNYTFTPIDLLTFNVGNTYYSFNAPPSTDELYAKLTVNTLLSPTLSMYWDCKESNRTGLFYALSVGHTFTPVKKLAINVGALVSYNQSNYSAQFASNNNYNDWHDYELSTGVDYSITDNIKISGSYTYSNAISDSARNMAGVKDESLYGLKAAFSF